MSKITTPFLFLLAAMLLSSCQAIGNIFSAGVWVGLTIALIVIIILVVVFRKKAETRFEELIGNGKIFIQCNCQIL